MTLTILVYILIGLVTIRPVAGHLAWSMHRNSKIRYPYLHGKDTHPNGEQWTGGVLTACGLACLWPAIILWYVTQEFIPSIGSERQAQLEAENAARDERDKELGLEPWKYGKVGK